MNPTTPLHLNFSSAGCVCESCATAEAKKNADALAAEHAQLLGELFTEWCVSMWNGNPRGWNEEETEKIWQLAEDRCKTLGLSAMEAFERFTLDAGKANNVSAETLPGVWRELFQLQSSS
jgi:hypothetical protein